MNDISLPLSSQPRTVPVYRSVEEIPADIAPSVAAIGNFDGVHRGHQEILNSVVTEARRLGVRAVAITFDPHPQRFLRPARAPKLLTPIDVRTRLMALSGLDAVVVLRFDSALAHLTAKEFVDRVLVGALGIRGLHEGSNFHFGHGAHAGVAALGRWGTGLGFGVHVHSSVKIRGLEVSSSAIRERIARGDLTHARWMLGRPFSIIGTPAHGRGIGSKQLVPTVNMAPYTELMPPFGVYVTRLKVGGRSFKAVTNVGNRPTFGEASFAVESHILDFEPIDLDETTPLELEFLMRLRGEITWPSPEALKAQIFKDVARAQKYFRLAGL
jgi:riboflavin kinase / FMN adenylyltransferase